MSASLSSPASGQEPKFRIAICGAGISGLILAITVGKYNPSIPIDLYEAHDSIDTVGAGISLWKQTVDVITELGLFDDFKHIITVNPNNTSTYSFRRGDIPEGGYFWYKITQESGGFAMARKDMVAILAKHIPQSCTVHYSKRLVSYADPKEQDEKSTSPIVLRFADGTTSTTDVLVGADGIRSQTRKTMFEIASEEGVDRKTDLKQYINATFTGMSVYRSMIPTEALKQKDLNHVSLTGLFGFSGKGAFFSTYLIANGALVNVVAISGNPSLTDTEYAGNWSGESTQEEMAQCFSNFEPDVKTVLGLCNNPSKWALHVVRPLPFWVRKNVALVGDACHAMAPNLGGGGGQAIEDGFILGQLLAHSTIQLSSIGDVLRIYERKRLPLAHEVARISLSAGWSQLLLDPYFYDGTRKDEDLDDRGISAYEREGMETLKQEALKRADWVKKYCGALETWEDAESELRKLTPN